MPPTGNHALVFGASGVAGWGLVEQLLDNYPKEGTFSKVTAVVNRPLDVENSYWPYLSPSRPELQLVSGVNLLKGTVEEFASALKQKVEGLEAVTHAYYFGDLSLVCNEVAC